MTDDRYKKAWESYLLYIWAQSVNGAETPETNKAFARAYKIACDYGLPIRTYDPDKEWVPVSSGQMPEEPGNYQITNINGEVCSYHTYGAAPVFSSDVLAWRNLPEPYKGEG